MTKLLNRPCFVLVRLAEQDLNFASSEKQQPTERNIAPLGQIIVTYPGEKTSEQLSAGPGLIKNINMRIFLNTTSY